MHIISDVMVGFGTKREEDLRRFYGYLKESRLVAAKKLQSTVYQNYGDFITVAKEMGQLDSDMAAMKGLLGDFRNVVKELLDMTAAKDSAAAAGSIGARRSMRLGSIGGEFSEAGVAEVDTNGDNVLQKAQMNRVLDAVLGIEARRDTAVVIFIVQYVPLPW